MAPHEPKFITTAESVGAAAVAVGPSLHHQPWCKCGYHVQH